MQKAEVRSIRTHAGPAAFGSARGAAGPRNLSSLRSLPLSLSAHISVSLLPSLTSPCVRVPFFASFPYRIYSLRGHTSNRRNFVERWDTNRSHSLAWRTSRTVRHDMKPTRGTPRTVRHDMKAVSPVKHEPASRIPPKRALPCDCQRTSERVRGRGGMSRGKRFAFSRIARLSTSEAHSLPLPLCRSVSLSCVCLSSPLFQSLLLHFSSSAASRGAGSTGAAASRGAGSTGRGGTGRDLT